MRPAFDLIFAHGNFEFAACERPRFLTFVGLLTLQDVVCLDVGTQLFASRPIDWESISTKYAALRPVASSGMNVFLSIRELLASLAAIEIVEKLTGQHFNMPKISLPIPKMLPHGICRERSRPTCR